MQTNEFKLEVLPLSKSMLRFAALFLKDSDASQDIVQEVFLKLWQIKDELEHIDNLKAFVTRMVRNKCLDHIRAGKKWVIKDTLEQKQVRWLTNTMLLNGPKPVPGSGH